MDNKELRKVLRNDKEKIMVPDRFKPENIEVMLGNTEKRGVSIDVKKASKRRIPRVPRRIITVAGTVAIFTLFIVTASFMYRQFITNGYYTELDNGFKQLTSYNRLESYLKMVNEEREEEKYTSSAGQTLSGSKGDATDYSDTNVRTEGINEADCVKTDGEYIYAYASNVLTIIEPDGENTRIMAEYYLHDWVPTYVLEAELMVYGDKLILVGDYYVSEFYYTMVVVLDITDVNAVAMIDSFTVEGRYVECRMYDEYLYVSTGYDFDYQKVSKMIPKIDGTDMNCLKVFFTDCEDYTSYYTIASFDMGEKPKLIDYTSVINDGEVEMYMTKENIYLLSQKYEEDTQTEILKFSHLEGEFEAKASIKVLGWLKDVFCVDEYNGYLRLVITSNKDMDLINTLYVFDDALNTIGKITDIAPGENIRSARFEGDLGYFVTYRSIDPLFTVDLSNPKEPKIIGELKIPGFSTYMHMWGEDKMLGIGRNDGLSLKLSMFDISNPENIVEESKHEFYDTWNSYALYDHKAVFINEEKNLIGFDFEGYIKQGDEYMTGYCIYSYENNKFVQKVLIEVGSHLWDIKLRGMYIGDYIYVVVADGHTVVLDINTFEEVAIVNEDDVYIDVK